MSQIHHGIRHGRVTTLRRGAIIGSILLFLLPATLFAQIGFRIGGLTFDPVAADSLYPEYLADPYSMSSGLKYLTVMDFESVPSTILVSDGHSYIEVPFAHYERSEFEDHRSFWQIKGFVNLGLARLSLGKAIEAEFAIAGGLNSVFQAFGGTDTLGFDGIWRLAGTLRLFKTVALRFGMHHFSGHWGDETIEDLPDYGEEGYVDYVAVEEYVRGNSWVAGISVTPFPWARLYFEAERPQEMAWLRPGIHIPVFVLTPDGSNLFEHVLRQEGLLGLVEAFGPLYQAWRLQTGAEFHLPIPGLGSLFVAGDLQLHQDGQTMHQVNQYSPDNPWELEYTVGGGLEYSRGFLGRRLRIEAYYHCGRFPLTNYFFQRSDYVSFGLAINN